MKTARILTAILAALFVFTGCSRGGKELNIHTSDTNTVKLHADGTVTSLVVEDFDQDYYNEEELNTFVKELEASYNEKAGAEIMKVKDYQVKDQTARLLLTYQTLDSYVQVESVPIQLLTAEKAIADETLPTSYQQIGEKKEPVDKTEAMSKPVDKVLVLNNGMSAILPGKIRYYANGMVLNDFMIQAEKGKACIVVYEEKK